MAERVQCELCGVIVPPHAHFVVRIDVFADPSLPQMTSEQLEEMDAEQTFRDLIEQMKHMSAEELQDAVHRRFEYTLCAACQKKVLANPLGKPRGTRAGEN